MTKQNTPPEDPNESAKAAVDKILSEAEQVPRGLPKGSNDNPTEGSKPLKKK